MLISWVVFPLLLAALCLGWGLLVEALTRAHLPGALLPGVGMAAIVVVAQLPALADATAELIVPVVVAGALAGAAVGLRGRDEAPCPWAIAAAATVFAAYAAPIVLSGEATFAGYVKLDDTATWLALTDRVMEHGRSLEGLAPSTYEATLDFNLGEGYPIGVFLPLGVGTALTGEDAAWLIQPYMATWAVLLALALWQLAGAVVSDARLRVAVAFVAAQPALLVGYYLWGGIKEIAAIAMIATVAALLPGAVNAPRARAAVPVAVVCAALLGVLSGGGAVWLLVPLAVGVFVAARRLGPPAALGRAAIVAVITALLSLPVLVAGGALPPTSSPLTASEAIGNLAGPLDPLQVAGIWPTGDFRFEPRDLLATRLIVAIAACGSALGVAAAWRRDGWAAVTFVLGALATAALLALAGSPWVEGKALATASVAVPFAAMLGAAALFAAGRRIEAAALAVVVAGGVLWSNALAFHDVNLAPRDQLAELEEVGGEIAGEGPTLLTEYQLYGARHFLRDADPEAVSDLRRRLIPRRDGEPVGKGLSADTDELSLPDLFVYRTLVLRRSPVASRPPAAYERTWAGDFYEVWQRPEDAVAPQRHLPLGSAADPVSRPPCAKVRALSALAGRDGLLLAARGAQVLEAPIGAGGYPAGWEDAKPSRPRPNGEGELRSALEVERRGDYGVWLGGGIRPRVELRLDGATVGEARHELQNEGGYVRLGAVELEPGRHELTLAFSGPDLHPGSDGIAEPIGPLLLTPVAGEGGLEQVDAAEAERLCGREWDWIEVG